MRAKDKFACDEVAQTQWFACTRVRELSRVISDEDRDEQLLYRECISQTSMFDYNIEQLHVRSRWSSRRTIKRSTATTIAVNDRMVNRDEDRDHDGERPLRPSAAEPLTSGTATLGWLLARLLAASGRATGGRRRRRRGQVAHGCMLRLSVGDETVGPWFRHQR